MPEPLQTNQENPWTEFFRRIRRLAAQLDTQKTDVEEAGNRPGQNKARR